MLPAAGDESLRAERLPPGLLAPPSNAGQGLGPPPGTILSQPAQEGGAAAAGTHYILDGPQDAGMLVVCIGGINDFSVRFGCLAHALLQGQLGVQVLRYDAYGRGWSSAPRGARFDLAFHVSQLEHVSPPAQVAP